MDRRKKIGLTMLALPYLAIWFVPFTLTFGLLAASLFAIGLTAFAAYVFFAFSLLRR